MKWTKVRISVFTVWLMTVTWFVISLTLYTNTPGEQGIALRRWPSESQLRIKKNYAKLLVFVHPDCFCSVATLGELERIIPFAREQMNISIVVSIPKNNPESFESYKAELIKKFPSEIVELFEDKNNLESSRFDARTSGQVLLYNATGELIFQGGITPSRGHMGDSAGQAAIKTFLTHEKSVFKTDQHSHVFGCTLYKREIAELRILK